MLTKFGLKEAERAGEFAKTDDQRRTVLAVVNMFGIPIKIKESGKRKKEKLNSFVRRKDVLVGTLKTKILSVQTRQGIAERECYKVEGITRDWCI